MSFVCVCVCLSVCVCVLRKGGGAYPFMVPIYDLLDICWYQLVRSRMGRETHMILPWTHCPVRNGAIQESVQAANLRLTVGAAWNRKLHRH